MRKALRADLREYPRYDIQARAQLAVEGRNLVVDVFDISEGGARIASVQRLTVGTKLVLTFQGLHSVAGKIVRLAEDGYGVCFEPQKLNMEEVRRLITAVAALRLPRSVSPPSRSCDGRAPAADVAGR